MLRAFSALALGALLAGSASAAPATCASNKYLDQATGTCKPCPRTAKTCTSATVSTSCVPRYYLTADGRCVANGQCPVSTFANHSNGKCDKCFLSTYKTCSNGKSYSATSCVAQHCLGAGRCMPFAQIKSTSHCNRNGTLAPCPGTGAGSCTVDGTTLSCNAPYFLNSTAPATATPPSSGDTAAPAGRRAASVGGTCVSSTGCGRAFYPDSKTRTCAPCGEHVARCDETGALECQYTYFLSEGKCVETCPDGQRPDQEDGTCVLASESCPEGQFYDSYSDSCVETCRDTAVVASDGVTILPALYGDTETMKCLQCRGGNAYRCNPNTGYARNCYASFAGPVAQEPYESDQTSTSCTTPLGCLEYDPRSPGLTTAVQSFTLPEDFAAALPQEERYIGYCYID